MGIVTTNRVVNRTVFAMAGGFLLLAGVSPKFAAPLTTIPQCVLGGATITVFSTIAMTGMKLIASQELTARGTPPSWVCPRRWAWASPRPPPH